MNIDRKSIKNHMHLVKLFPLMPINNNAHLDKAIKIVQSLTVRQDLTKQEHNYMSVLCDLIEDYESRKFHNKRETSPQEALAYLLKENHLTPAYLARTLKLSSDISAFVQGNGKLSAADILKLSEHFKVSPELFAAADTKS